MAAAESRPSDARPVGAITVTLMRRVIPRPVFGSIKVGIAIPADLDELIGVARRRDGPISQQEELVGRTVAGADSLDADPPAQLAWRRFARGDVAGQRNQRAREAPRSQDGPRLVGRVAFDNPAEVEPHVGLEQFDRPGPFIEPNRLVSNPLPGGRQRLGARQPLGPARLAPQVDQRADRHIESPFRAARQFE